MNARQRHIFVILAWIALAVYFALVAWVCFGHFTQLPDMSQPIWGIPQDKLIHFVMFLPFPFLVMFTRRRRPATHRKALWLTVVSLVIGLAIAGATEWGQGLTLHRDRNPYDFLADAIALVFGSLIVLIISFHQVRRASR